MTPRALERGRLKTGLLVTICIAVVAYVTVSAASATAATQHWASASTAIEAVPSESAQPFTAKSASTVNLLSRFGGARIEMTCNTLSSSGSVYNPALNTAAGGLGTTSLELNGCTVSIPSCALKGGSIPFTTLKGHARTEDGKRLVMEPQAGSTMTVLEFENDGAGRCELPSLRVEGYLEAIQYPEDPGYYYLSSEPSHLTIGSSEFSMSGEFSLSTPSERLLVLSTEGSGEPRWYFNQGEWSLIKAGESTSFVNSYPVPLTISSKIGLAKVTISGCEGSLGGHVENPAGGGAGKASGTWTPGACNTSMEHCSVVSTGTNEMSGVATEVGDAPAVEWTPKSGSTVFSFEVVSVGSPCPLAPNSPLHFTGKLITTSLGHGRFSLAGSELKYGMQAAQASSEFRLETLFGDILRLQP